MPASRIQELFGGGGERERTPSGRQLELEALLPEYAARLTRKGVTVKSLFEEYRRDYPNGWCHAGFGLYIQRYRPVSRAVGHAGHYAADQMHIDFAGDRLQIVDEKTGEVRSVEVFVAILPCSHCTCCEAVWPQKKEDLIKACENALLFHGGVPMAIVPDNLKSAVTRSDRNERVINEDFAAFAAHYGCAVSPARVRHPKDKALVENAVKLMYKSVYTDVEGLRFHNPESLDAAIIRSPGKFNDRKLTGRSRSRRQLFEEVEKDYLRTLPSVRYQMKERKSVTVMRNSYVTPGRHRYSVPREYTGKRVDIVYDADTLDIFHGLKLVTAHPRDDTPHSYSRKEAHPLPGRHGSYEKNPDEVFERAARIGNTVLLYLGEVASEKKDPPQAFRSCGEASLLWKRPLVCQPVPVPRRCVCTDIRM